MNIHSITFEMACSRCDCLETVETEIDDDSLPLRAIAESAAARAGWSIDHETCPTCTRAIDAQNLKAQEAEFQRSR